MVGAVRFSSRSRVLTTLLPPVLDCSPILSSFQVILLEHIIMCRLVTGHKATALQEVRPPGLRAWGGRVSGVTVREDVHLPSVFVRSSCVISLYLGCLGPCMGTVDQTV